MRVTVAHSTRVEYVSDVIEGVMDVRLGPLSDDHQRWLRFELNAAPNASVGRYRDGFGNAAHLITLRRPHSYVEVTTRSEVETLLDDPFAFPSRPPAPLTAAERVEYVLPSMLVPPDVRLLPLAAPMRPESPTEVFESARRLMSFVHAELKYEQRVTNVATSVTDVLDDRRGVCQDFAHVLIGLCRAIDIPSRYVSGYIVTGDAAHPETTERRGADASHAWVEAYTPTHGWRGFDPTNDLVANAHHVKMAVGRDYRDVGPTRGAYRGQTEETMSVVVTARPLAA
jgi:transglutaminase-like putative cysteine protease